MIFRVMLFSLAFKQEEKHQQNTGIISQIHLGVIGIQSQTQQGWD